MPRVVFTHSVSDRALWASKHTERVDVHDMSAMQAALSSPDLAAAKQAHGVIEPIHVLIAAVSPGEAA